MQRLVDDIAVAVRAIDNCGTPFKQFQKGVGPYGEPQLTKLIAKQLAQLPDRYPGAKTCRVPDLLVPNCWALEFKIVRPFGDNGVEAEHWSQNLLHPYPGNVSAISDVYKLMNWKGPEKRGVVVIAYEHSPPRIDTSILVSAFEVLCRDLLKLPLGVRHWQIVENCVYPIHQRANVYGWTLNEGGRWIARWRLINALRFESSAAESPLAVVEGPFVAGVALADERFGLSARPIFEFAVGRPGGSEGGF
jgi:hypothetical protein